MDVFKLADCLFSRDAITKPIYKDVIDEHTGLSCARRFQKLMSHICDAVQINGTVFNKLLLSLEECEAEQALLDQLRQCYSK